ncbi:C6orf134 protein, putative [Trichomonas vaginalis G3]|uniref:Alpha-tubulin N-acetyltransferase n=1 Tax=Trichomonas vaginalis (strain ATCC PRA-98 / G3) TaxID=412133 RepID=A2F3W7_TRIV3|nr:alpha-tubulin acetylation [Trichomonas vaginalis G3]EAY00383.1 C6orf134 protein, putative [Trichomonas vaginalis G3]KAI5528352.1 alpha-tubulin acetylation [Trichomonas vaginalis G3]|eukprot:XP_001313312.1 C6orf134 protein [Trichomonas vaginalis G3]
MRKTVLRPNEEHFVVLEPKDVARASFDVIDLINKLGEDSSRTQGLKHIITTYSSFSNSDNNRLYILYDDGNTRPVGFIKTGYKHLYIFDVYGFQHEMTPLCLLDFFVCNDVQRRGYGKKMYDYMLKCENVEPQQIAIDRPSPLCLSFMKKHFGLSEYVPQTNNFVVFNQYFETKETPSYPKPNISMTPQKPKYHPVDFSTLNQNNNRVSTPQKQRYNPITWEPM